MFTNVGSKIKAFAVVLFVILILISIFPAMIAYGAFQWQSQGLAIILAIVIIAVGVLAGWISTLFLYGYGQLIEDTSAIRRKVEQNATRASASASTLQPGTAQKTSKEGEIPKVETKLWFEK